MARPAVMEVAGTNWGERSVRLLVLLRYLGQILGIRWEWKTWDALILALQLVFSSKQLNDQRGLVHIADHTKGDRLVGGFSWLLSSWPKRCKAVSGNAQHTC